MTWTIRARWGREVASKMDRGKYFRMQPGSTERMPGAFWIRANSMRWGWAFQFKGFCKCLCLRYSEVQYLYYLIIWVGREFSFLQKLHTDLLKFEIEVNRLRT